MRCDNPRVRISTAAQGKGGGRVNLSAIHYFLTSKMFERSFYLTSCNIRRPIIASVGEEGKWSPYLTGSLLHECEMCGRKQGQLNRPRASFSLSSVWPVISLILKPEIIIS